eukprot:TRINITY_DN30425_c0_g1_i1.p1 TRINITY_DN30425_c0_g1~~TRINITY_DN30425_c0_g1_i1.p1  ORF type:complete len:305 (-),score=40.77 TRINITY_DN30425_c0_g1_i1:276-1190(-)
MTSNITSDLLGDVVVDLDPRASLDRDLFSVGATPPGKTVDLSGGSKTSPATSYVASSSYSGAPLNGGLSSSSSSSRGFVGIEGGRPGLSLAGLTLANIIRQLSSRPMLELVQEHSRHVLDIPVYVARTYSAASRRYLRPWNEFLRLRPANILEGFRNASRRGEVQIHIQNNVLANARSFCPNYALLFLATLFMFVCTSPALLCILGVVGGGWSHALRSDDFRNQPWTLQIGSIQVPLGANLKMLLMSLPTLFILHLFLGPVLWSAAFCSGGFSLGHAALRDRDDDRNDDDHGLGSSPNGMHNMA